MATRSTGKSEGIHPLSVWSIEGSYDTASECREAQTKSDDRLVPPVWGMAQCIPTDAPRLKEEWRVAGEIQIIACGYSAHCTVRGCRAQATRLARYTDGQGRPLRQRELCERHADCLKARTGGTSTI